MDRATAAPSTLSLHDALPILSGRCDRLLDAVRAVGGDVQPGERRNAQTTPSLRNRASSSGPTPSAPSTSSVSRSEEHTSELQSLTKHVCRLLLEKKNTTGIPR